jgi:hypothetical protein
MSREILQYFYEFHAAVVATTNLFIYLWKVPISILIGTVNIDYFVCDIQKVIYKSAVDNLQ